jgi:7-carboxy-7-deazaguanine synthase
MSLPADRIPIMERFVAVQGEGRNLGRPYYFIRVGGCPLRCNHCDTEKSWTVSKESIQSVGSVIAEAVEVCQLNHIRWVSITGGEPLLYPEQLLTIIRAMSSRGIYTHIETSGRFHNKEVHLSCQLYSPDAKTPCTGETMDGYLAGMEYLRPVDQVKCLINSEKDLEYAHRVNVALAGRCTMVLQPFNFNVVTDSTKNMTQIMAAERLRDKPQLVALRTSLCVGLGWLMETFFKRCKLGEVWHDTIITPQIHVLAHGNVSGT